MSEYTVNKTF